MCFRAPEGENHLSGAREVKFMCTLNLPRCLSMGSGGLADQVARLGTRGPLLATGPGDRAAQP